MVNCVCGVRMKRGTLDNGMLSYTCPACGQTTVITADDIDIIMDRHKGALEKLSRM